MSAADIFMSSILRTVVSSLELCFMQVDWLNFIGISCLYQCWAVVRVPVVLADNTATPSLTAPIISQSASSPVARPAATPPTHSLITKRVMALLHQHTSAKNTTHKTCNISSRTPTPPRSFLVPSCKKLDAATCQLKCSLLSKYSHVLQLCGREANMGLTVWWRWEIVQSCDPPC